ncbi:MAG: tyrosine-type recombinase/integrase [Streptosporangiaceae bacterium]
MRHACASRLYGEGIGLAAIQQLLGHRWLSTTVRYVNPQELHQMGTFALVA